MEAQDNINESTKGFALRNSIQEWTSRMVWFELAFQLNGERQSRGDNEKNEMVRHLGRITTMIVKVK